MRALSIARRLILKYDPCGIILFLFLFLFIPHLTAFILPAEGGKR